MGAGPGTTPLSFVQAALRLQGALTERSGETLEALLPPALADRLGAPEALVLREAGAPDGQDESAAQRIDREHGLVRAVAALAHGQGRVAAVALHAPSPQQLPLHRVVAERYPVRGASAKAEPARSGLADYSVFSFAWRLVGDGGPAAPLAVILSDETGLEPAGLLLATTAWDLAWRTHTPTPLDAAEAQRLYSQAMARAQVGVAAALAPRLRRDGQRLGRLLHDVDRYAESWREEVFTTIARRKLSAEEVERRKQRVARGSESLERLKGRLAAAAARTVELRLLGVLRLRLPVLRTIYALRSGRHERSVTVVRSLLTQSWEPLRCESCGRPAFGLALCSAAGHLICRACLQQPAVDDAPACGACRQH